MNARLLNFSLCSLCLHVAVPWLLLHAGTFEHGIADMERILEVSLIADQERPQAPMEPPSESGMHFPEPLPVAGNAAASSPSQLPETSVLSATAQAVARDVTAAGRLTRLPVPLTEIDLNVPEISESGFRGEARLTVLIDADGSVVDVTSLENLPGLDEFAERVAARFRNARFMPGEIDGRPVRSQLQITVVSEIPASTDTR